MIRYLASAASALTMVSVLVMATGAHAGTVTESLTAPTLDIVASQLTDLGPGVFDGGRNYADNGGPPGQTFTVLAATMANRITVLGRGDSAGSWNNGAQPFEGDEVWKIQIASVNTATGALTEIVQDTAPGFVAPANLTSYLTFTLTNPMSLVPGTTYAFSLVIDDIPLSNNTWYGMAHSDTDVYAGGTAFNNDLSTTTHTNGAAEKRVFNGFVNPAVTNNAAASPYDYVFAVQSVAQNLGPGDVNGDGFTNSVDYGFIKNNYFLTPATRAQGDLNGDGRVNLSDFTLWRNNVPASVAASVGIPEPSSLALAAGAAALFAFCGRRARRGK